VVSRAPCIKMVPRNFCDDSKDDIIARRYFSPALARSTPFNRAISCELKSPKNCVEFSLKGTVPRDFRLQVFYMDQFPQAPDYTIRAVSNFSENSRRYLELKLHHQRPVKLVTNLRIFKKIRYDPNAIFRGLGKDD
jgi:hypothetical protein